MDLQSKLEPGVGIAINLLFLDQKAWGFQFRLACQLRAQGVPIESLTVAAGVPSLDKANDIISAMKEAGMSYITFKPGSSEAVLLVAAIADANPDFPIMLQYTGGRAGGHHSYEDMHQPLLETYAALR